MSDQQTPPPKPKPGSLRDRIAAFEKPAGNAPPPGPAPAPRPKPGGFSWKPKQPSPPSSPSSGDGERKAGGTMSASDAKESIGKGVSLKERMAALQNRGAFGAPPPVAPKPALEKPKWKPPPAITPVDNDDDDEPSRRESSKSPPPIRKLSLDRPKEEGVEEESKHPAEGRDQGEADPEEEERQRRAAIAARMARLGGARVGMAPMFGRQPAAKKPEAQEEEPANVQAPKEDEAMKDISAASPPSDIVAEEASQPSETSPERSAKPTRKGSASSSLLSDPEAQQSRSPPTSMPLPSAPRRAGPPRKKAVKSPEIPPAAVLAQPLTDSPDSVPTSDPAGAPEMSAVIEESAKKAAAGNLEEEIGEVDKDAVEPTEIVSSPENVPAPPGVEFTKKESVIDEQFDEEDAAQEEDTVPIVGEDSAQLQATVEEALDKTVTPSHSVAIPQEAGVDAHQERAVEAEELDAPDTEDSPSKAEDGREEAVTGAADESEEDEEAARRQRIAEKLAKMGGVNPFAAPPQRRPSGSSEDIQTSPPLTKRASVGSPPPQQRRKSSLETSQSAEVTSGSLSETRSQDGK
ncbi:putative SH3 domain-containing protein [Lyophyllum shimeji]|uniref:SH3 domain-containing protein n=1 Tax=Lyophyllum shimeji TaxID=47721 RepID=A0A9P3PNT3_LYOSH|nr:putative SH3 domain-containing protein [Lyophyllum shimeji]